MTAFSWDVKYCLLATFLTKQQLQLTQGKNPNCAKIAVIAEWRQVTKVKGDIFPGVTRPVRCSWAWQRQLAAPFPVGQGCSHPWLPGCRTSLREHPSPAAELWYPQAHSCPAGHFRIPQERKAPFLPGYKEVISSQPLPLKESAILFKNLLAFLTNFYVPLTSFYISPRLFLNLFIMQYFPSYLRFF